MTTPDINPANPANPADASEADVLEQATPAGLGQHVVASELPPESDEGDAAEQAVVVELDEDDYR